MGASKIGKSDRQQCTIKSCMLLRGHGSCFCFLCVLFWWCCCVDSSQIYFLLWNLKLTHCKLSALKTGLWCIRQTILSHVVYIYIECSYHRVPWILALCTTWMWWYCCWYPDDDDNDEAPGTAAAFIGAGIFGQHMTSLGPKAPYFLSNALLVEFLWSKRGGHDIFVV